MNKECKTFEQIPISTTTIIVKSNITVDLDELYRLLPVTPIEVDDSITNKNKIKEAILAIGLPLGTIISVQFRDQSRGVKMTKSTKSTYFRNNMSIYILIKDKIMNFKVPIQGKMQITGATRQEQATSCVKYFIQHLLDLPKKVYTIQDGMTIKLIFKTVMTDIVFNVGFKVDRQKLDHYINRSNNGYTSTLETSVGYTGVNIKHPFTHEDTEMLTIELDEKNRVWSEGTTTFTKYLDSLSPSDRKKEISKKRYNTFLVFYSGTAIMSGMTPYYMKDIYYNFNQMLQNDRKKVEEVGVV
jgi:hypothetical protein